MRVGIKTDCRPTDILAFAEAPTYAGAARASCEIGPVAGLRDNSGNLPMYCDVGVPENRP